MSSHEASKVSALKDQAVGVIKETMGNMLGKEDLEMKGKAQKVHGKNEYEFAKAQKAGHTEPEHFEQAHHGPTVPQPNQPIHDPNYQPIQEPMHQQPMHQQPIPPAPAPLNTNPPPPPAGPVNPAAAVGPVPPVGPTSAPPPPAQPITSNVAHPPPPQPTGHAQGTVEADKPSTLGALKDKTMGSIKQTLGSATGNQSLEMQGAAQQMHGRNEAEFAKAEKEGMSEPAHYEHGTKVTHHASGQVEGQEDPSKISGYKDQTLGAAKEKLGSMTGNQQTELEGKAQKIHGSNQCAYAEEKKNTINA